MLLYGAIDPGGRLKRRRGNFVRAAFGEEPTKTLTFLTVKCFS